MLCVTSKGSRGILSLQCIGGSRGGVPGSRPPLWDPILSFLHTFSLKSTRVGDPHPPQMGACRPLREILDPPLQWVII